jgi:hypothetical protein
VEAVNDSEAQIIAARLRDEWPSTSHGAHNMLAKVVYRIVTEDRARLGEEIAKAIVDEDRWRFVEGEGRARFDSARIAREVAMPPSEGNEPVPSKVQVGGIEWTLVPDEGYYRAGVGRMTPTRLRTLRGEGRATVTEWLARPS